MKDQDREQCVQERTLGQNTVLLGQFRDVVETGGEAQGSEGHGCVDGGVCEDGEEEHSMMVWVVWVVCVNALIN